MINRLPPQSVPMTDEELARDGISREDYEAFDEMIVEGGSDDPQPGDPDFDSSVPPYVVDYTNGSFGQRFMFDPKTDRHGIHVGNGHARVYELGAEDVAAMANMAFVEQLAYVQNLNLGRLKVIAERGGERLPFDPYQLPQIEA